MAIVVDHPIAKVYSQPNLTFIVYPEKIYIKTGLGQLFYLQPKAYCWRRREHVIMNMIEIGEIRNLNELASWCGIGIEWVATTQHIELH